MKRIALLAALLVALVTMTACGGEKTETEPAPLPTPIATYAFVSSGAGDVADKPADEETADDEATADEEPADTKADAGDVADEPVDEETAADEATADEEATTEEAPATDESDDSYAGLPASVAAAMENADASRGEQLTLQNACTGCHNLDPDVQMVGPTWSNLAETAATRVEGESAIEYIYTSITDPNAHVVDGFPPNVMAPTYGDTLSDQDLADIITYLLEAGE